MPNKTKRITKDKDFSRVFKEGKASYNKLIGIKALANHLEQLRIGIIVSNKVSRKAVERNLLKRQVREIMQREAERVKKGHDLVIIVLPEARKRNYQELTVSIRESLASLKLHTNNEKSS